MWGQAVKKLQDVLAHQRLPAGDAQFPDAQFNEGCAKAGQLFQCQKFFLWQEGHVFRHAVNTTKIAPVGHREADIGNGAAKRVNEAIVIEIVDPCHFFTGGCLFRLSLIISLFELNFVHYCAHPWLLFSDCALPSGSFIGALMYQGGVDCKGGPKTPI